jgi:uncharacterized membrane protein
MNEEDSEARIARLEASLTDLAARFAALEKRLTPPPLPPSVRVWQRAPELDAETESAIPSVEVPTESPVAEVAPPIIQAPPVVTRLDPVVPPPSSHPDDLEYRFGINGLLRGGAAVILIAFLFLAVLLIGRGYITPVVQFGGEVLLSFALIGVGLWKRDEREDFGQLMVGLGSGGLYASFAGGHLAQHLYSGEVLVGLFFGLSLANFAFAHWRSSQSFLTLGLFGGLIAAMMTMQNQLVGLDLCLYFLILAPCSAIIIRNRWPMLAVAMWLVSSLALLPAVLAHFDQTIRVGAIYANCGIALFTFGKVARHGEFENRESMQPFMMLASGLFAVGIDYGAKGSLHCVALAAIGLGISQLLGDDRKIRDATLLGALIVFTVLTPIGLSPMRAAVMYGGESIVLAIVALQYRQRNTWILGLVTLLLGLIAYVSGSSVGTVRLASIPVGWETLLIGVLSVSILLQIRFALRETESEIGDLTLFVGSSLLVILFVRFVEIQISGPGAKTWLSNQNSDTLALILASVALTFISRSTPRTGLVITSLIVSTWVGAQALAAEPTSDPQWLTALGLAVTAVNAWFSSGMRILEDPSKAMESVAFLFARGLLLSIVATRMMQIAGTHQILGLDQYSVIFFTFAILNLIWTFIAVVRPSRDSFALAWLSLVMGGASSFGIVADGSGIWLKDLLLVASIMSLGILYVRTPRSNDRDEQSVSVATIAGGWALPSSLLQQVLRSSPFELAISPAVTVSWVLFAVVLISVGFRFDRRFLRYGSLAIFAVTVLKVFWLDLSELDPLIRVGILMLLGFGMVGGGYWYIVWRRGVSPEVSEETTLP